MADIFTSSPWHDAIAGVIRGDNHDDCASSLSRAIDLLVQHEGTCLLAFHRDASPDLIHHSLEPKSREHYVDRYLAGPYLLDPLYQLAIADEKPGLCRFRDQLPDRFRSSQYYRQYCERTHLLDEMDYLLDISASTTVVLVVGRRSRIFKKAELRRLQIVEPTIQAGMQRAWQLFEQQTVPATDTVHRRLTDCFDRFGAGVLTERERQISQLLLRGHSSKSIARVLDIAPGTVMVHKRNLFEKLQISSQFELFSLYIDSLGAEQG